MGGLEVDFTWHNSDLRLSCLQLFQIIKKKDWITDFSVSSVNQPWNFRKIVANELNSDLLIIHQSKEN